MEAVQPRSISYTHRFIAVAIALIVVVLLLRSCKAPKTSTVQMTGTTTEEASIAEQLSSSTDNQIAFNFAVDWIKDFFKESGMETAAFRLSEIHDYYISPAKEKNGCDLSKKLAIRFALKCKGEDLWINLEDMSEFPAEYDMWGGKPKTEFFHWEDLHYRSDTLEKKDLHIDVERINGKLRAGLYAGDGVMRVDDLEDNLRTAIAMTCAPKPDE